MLRDRPRSPSEIIESLKRDTELPPSPAGQAPSVAVGSDGIEPWPDENAEYTAAGRNAAHSLETLFFLTQGRMPRGFAYANLEEVFLQASEMPGQGPVLVARFHGSRVTEVMIEGRGLRSICGDLGRRVVPWLWELPTGRDFKDAGKAAITKIHFNEQK